MLSGVTSLFSRDPAKDFPYTIGESLVALDNKSIWNLNKAQKKATKQNFSAFVYNVDRGSAHGVELAKASVKRLKTLRHPNILMFVDSLETDKLVYMVTEQCVPLFEYLDKLPQKLSEEIIAWGLHQVLKGLEFINEQCNLCHNAVSTSSIFVTSTGEWKICGFEYVTTPDQPLPSKKFLKAVEVFEAPEISANQATKPVNTWAADMWSYGAVVYEVFNGKLYDKKSVANVLSLPSTFRATYSELTSANPVHRPSPSQVLERNSKPGGFFNNDFLNTMKELDEIHLKSPEEKSRLLRRLNTLLDAMPPELSRSKVIPALISVFDFGTPDFTILPVLLKIGVLMQPEDFQKRVVPCVVKMFASPDRATRIHLLQNLKSYVDHLSKAVINKEIFQHVCMGFLDTNPAMREETVKAMSLIAPKLDNKNLNEELMKYFARLQAQDEEGPIRTNTTICIAKIAPCMTPETREKVLPSAFSRAIRDPFEPARIAGIGGFMETHEYFTIKDTASKVVPVLCTATVDADKKVRDQAFKAIQTLLERLKQVSEKPELLEEFESKVKAGSTSVVNQLASSWIGAAVSSLATRFKQQPLPKPPTAAGGEHGVEAPTTAAASDDGNDDGSRGGSFSTRTPSPLMSQKIINNNNNDAASPSTRKPSPQLTPTKSSAESSSNRRQSNNNNISTKHQPSSWENDLWLSLDDNNNSADVSVNDGKPNSNNNNTNSGQKLLVPKPSASTQSFHGWDEPSDDMLLPTSNDTNNSNKSGGVSSSDWSATFPALNSSSNSIVAAAAAAAKSSNNNNNLNILQPTRSSTATSRAANNRNTGAALDDDFFNSMLSNPSSSSSKRNQPKSFPKPPSAAQQTASEDWDPFGTRGSEDNTSGQPQRRPGGGGSGGGKPMKLSAKRIG